LSEALLEAVQRSLLLFAGSAEPIKQRLAGFRLLLSNVVVEAADDFIRVARLLAKLVREVLSVPVLLIEPKREAF
jgi:hypothetical protein